jgi:UDPglucose 6-dehydrogenase
LNVATIGTGYVGLVTGACLVEIGHQVICVDTDEEKIKSLLSGKLPIYEPGLGELIKRGLENERLSFSSSTEEATERSDIVFITVGTPQAQDGTADMSAVKSASKSIAKGVNSYKVIVNKSTMPVGSTKMVEKIILENMPVRHELDVVSNPEFLREGSAVDDFLHPDRIVIGTNSQKAAGIMSELYRPIKAPLMITDPASAEVIKYASNCFLATKVSFINAISSICRQVGADVKEVALGMGYDHRIGFEFLKAGPGFGGSCFPKDCQAMIAIAKENNYDFYLLEGALRVNFQQKQLIAKRAEELLGEGKTVGILGLAFKPNTDDMREAPSIDIIKSLLSSKHKVVAYDPVAMPKANLLLPEVIYAKDSYEVAKQSDLILLLTEWDEFRWLDWRKVKTLMNNPIVFDTRNCLDPNVLRKLGFVYEGIGR